jgi:hypothetical protein
MFVAAFAALGAILGLALPKYEASAFVRLPQAVADKEMPGRVKDDRDRVVDLPRFRRVTASYGSQGQLNAFLQAKRLQDSPAAIRLVASARDPRFWEKVATPMLPFSRRDQRELGDLKDAAVAVLLGIDLRVDAAARGLAMDMINILAKYYSNAVMRERIRDWVLAGKAENVGQAKTIEAAIVRAQLDMVLLERRVQDMKTILSKYPAAERMDIRQVISLNASDESQRFLSPLAQLVGFESAISQRQEQVRRWDRELKQKQLLGTFFSDAVATLESTLLVEQLLPALRKLAAERLERADSSQEWVREASLRLLGQLDSFDVMIDEFSLAQEGIRINQARLRDPLSLAWLMGVLAILLLGVLVALRVILRREA